MLVKVSNRSSRSYCKIIASQLGANIKLQFIGRWRRLIFTFRTKSLGVPARSRYSLLLQLRVANLKEKSQKKKEHTYINTFVINCKHIETLPYCYVLGIEIRNSLYSYMSCLFVKSVNLSRYKSKKINAITQANHRSNGLAIKFRKLWKATVI